MPFDATAQTPWVVPFAFDDYLELVDLLSDMQLESFKQTGSLKVKQEAVSDDENNMSLFTA